jgi:hypothetical protein
MVATPIPISHPGEFSISELARLAIGLFRGRRYTAHDSVSIDGRPRPITVFVP